MARTPFAENVELEHLLMLRYSAIRSLYGRSEDYLAVFILWFDLIPQGLDIVSNLGDVNVVEELMTMMVEQMLVMTFTFLPMITMIFELMLLLLVTRQVVTDCCKIRCY